MGSLGKVYLIAYNVIQVLGWSYLMIMLLPFLKKEFLFSPSGDTPVHAGLYDSVQLPLKIFQTAAVIEIIHAAVGLVKSNPVITGLQIFSRVFILWAILHSFVEAQRSFGLPLLLVAWTVTEIVRYSYYALNLLRLNVSIVTWLRYTLFIVLYPIGVTGELLCCYVSLPVVAATGAFSVALPNRWNATFSFYHILIALMLSYAPVFPQLYGYMLAQRKKVLGGGIDAGQKKEE